MRRDYRDRRGRHSPDPSGLSRGAPAPTRALLRRFDREAGEARIAKIRRDRPGLEGLQALEPLLFAADVALVPHAVFQDGEFLTIEIAKELGGHPRERICC